MRTTRECEWCEKVFTSKSTANKYCCVECRKEAQAFKQKYDRQKDRERRGLGIRPTKKAKLTIEEICRRAKAEGLSYGKYVEKYGV